MTKAPVFVKIDEFKEILASLNTIKGKLNEANGVLEQINALKEREETEINTWQETLNQVGEKVNSMDSVLFDQGQ